MKCKCPACGAAFSLDVLIAHEEARGLIVELMKHSLPFGSLVIRYLALFRPEKQELRMSRVAGLLRELLPDVARGAITRKGRDWAVTQRDWQGGLELVMAAHEKGSLTTPLTDHAYLYEIMMRHIDKSEGAAEKAQEAEKRNVRVRPEATLKMDNAGFMSQEAMLAEGKRRRAGGETTASRAE